MFASVAEKSYEAVRQAQSHCRHHVLLSADSTCCDQCLAVHHWCHLLFKGIHLTWVGDKRPAHLVVATHSHLCRLVPGKSSFIHSGYFYSTSL